MPCQVDPSLWALFLVALSASFHCAGMCGGFVLAACRQGVKLTLDPASKASILRIQALYHLGKATSYVVLGTIAGQLGFAFLRGGSWAARILSTTGALLFLWAGWRSLGFALPAPEGWRAALRSFGDLLLRPIATSLASLRSSMTPLLLGSLSGLLPCPVVYAFAASAAARANFLGGAAVMSMLELGTIPTLLALALTGRTAPPFLRHRLARLSGVLMILLGVWTFYRGWTEPGCCTNAAAMRAR